MHRFKQFILWIGCLFTVGGIWVACYFQVDHDRNQAQTTAETNVNNFAKAFEEYVLSTVVQIDSTLLTMRDDYEQHPRHFKEQLAIYKKNLYHHLIIQVSVIDADGMMVFNEQAMPRVPLDLSDREHFRVHRNSGRDILFISKPVLGRVSQRWSIQFTRKIFHRDGSFGGVIVISVDPEFFSSYFRSFDLGKNGVVTLVGTDRVLRARSIAGKLPDAKEHVLPPDRPFFNPNNPAAGTYRVSGVMDGVARIHAYRRMQDYPLMLSVGVTEADVFGPANSRRSVLVLWGLIVSTLLLIGTRIIVLLDKQQRRIDQSLREANQRLELATASGHLGIWEWDITTGALTWDDRMHELYGFARGTFSGRDADFQTALHPGDLADTLEAVRAAVGGEKDFSTEFRAVHPDGTVKVIKADGLVLRDAAGRAVRMVGLNSDATERVTAVNALRESEKRFRTLADASFEGIAIIEGERYLDVNSQLARMLGFERTELIGLEVAATLPPDCAHEIAGILSGCEEHHEHEMQGKDGSRRFVEVHGQSMVQNGRELRITAIRDITERKRMEKALHDSEEQFRTLCDAAPIGIFRSDGAGKTIYCNPRWEEITGIPASAALGACWTSGSHPEDGEELGKVWLEAVTQGRVLSHEHRHLTPQGKTIWVRALATPLKRPDGTVLSHVGTLDDITDLRQARQDLLKTQKLESLGVLAGGLAHDFNNILTAVFGNIALARFQIDDPETVSKRLEEAEKAMARATDLTRQLLTFAKGGAPIKKIVKVNELLQEAAGFALHGSKANCRFELADDIWPVEADEGQLVQVVHNLMLNAVQAMPNGGTVTVAAEKQSSPAGERLVKISVTDTGVGIPESDLPKIFDPYFTTKPQGNGLGLATCYSIVKKHGGTIGVASTVGKGSVFVVSLPASERENAADPKSAARLFHGSGRVLVMDDDAGIRAVAQGILQELGYTVEVAEDGAGALDLYLKRKNQGIPFSVVILDMTIPGGMGGKEAMEKLLELDPAVKAVVSSGYSSDTVMADYRDHGFLAVLNKPYLPQEMSKVLMELTASAGAKG